MTAFIPSQLQHPSFRFVLVGRASKTPVERQWTTVNNYQHADPKLQDWIAAGNNYAVCCGYGNLGVIDADVPALAQRFEERLGPTFRVRSGSGRGFHDYAIVSGLERHVIFEKYGEHLGELQYHRHLVVGPGSIHPTGGRYEIARDAPIIHISAADFLTAFDEFVRKPRASAVATHVPHRDWSGGGSAIAAIPITAILHNYQGVWRGEWIHGKNPWHGAKTGHNFSINTVENYWQCWHCKTRGGAARAIALTEGIITHCDDRLTREEFLRVVRIAREKYRLSDG